MVLNNQQWLICHKIKSNQNWWKNFLSLLWKSIFCGYYTYNRKKNVKYLSSTSAKIMDTTYLLLDKNFLSVTLLSQNNRVTVDSLLNHIQAFFISLVFASRIQTAETQNNLHPSECFPTTYDLDIFKFKVNKYIISL